MSATLDRTVWDRLAMAVVVLLSAAAGLLFYGDRQSAADSRWARQSPDAPPLPLPASGVPATP